MHHVLPPHVRSKAAWSEPPPPAFCCSLQCRVFTGGSRERIFINLSLFRVRDSSLSGIMAIHLCLLVIKMSFLVWKDGASKCSIFNVVKYEIYAISNCACVIFWGYVCEILKCYQFIKYKFWTTILDTLSAKGTVNMFVYKVPKSKDTMGSKIK